MTTIVLTARDMDLLAFLALHREVPVDLLARRFFAKNPFTGAPNAVPLKPCTRRLRDLSAHGYLHLERVTETPGRRSRPVARIAERADNPLGQRAARRSINPKERIHHLRTLEAVRRVELAAQRRGGRLIEFRVEGALRAAAQRGRKTRRGDSFDAFPDALCTIAYPRNGGQRVVRIAVEYVTVKYTSAAIDAKHDSFQREYDGAAWFADKRSTAERVKRLTGATCSLLT